MRSFGRPQVVLDTGHRKAKQLTPSASLTVPASPFRRVESDVLEHGTPRASELEKITPGRYRID